MFQEEKYLHNKNQTDSYKLSFQCSYALSYSGSDEIQQVSTSDNVTEYQEPTINQNGEWELSPYDIEAIAIGAGILGTGGGGSPYVGKLRCLKALDEGKKIRVVTPER